MVVKKKAASRRKTKPSARKTTKKATARAKSVPDVTHAGITSSAVRKATGKGWNEWFAILDARGAHKMEHKAIAEHLSAQENVPPWWSQMVTVGYEQARGLRKKHETKQGWSVSASRVVGVPAAAAWSAFDDIEKRVCWHPGSKWKVSSATKNKSLRAALADGTRLEVMFQPKGAGRSQVTVQHNKIASEKQAAAHKRSWALRLDRLRTMLESSAL